MRNARRNGSIAGSPALVGSVTVLIAIVAVFLAYNANEGLPFVPTKTLYVELPDGAMVTKGNDVRRGGFRIGAVSEVDTHEVNGRTVARVTIKLDEKHGDIPVDSRFAVRSRSLLGIKYVDIEGGDSRSTFADEATVPAAQAEIPVQIDEVTSVFDSRTRTGVRQVLGGLGDGFAGRGADLNETFGTLPVLLPKLERVMRTLAAPGNRFGELITVLDRTATALQPVAREQAHLFGVAATTFAAFVRNPDRLRETISEWPRTLATVTPALERSRPFLQHAAELGEPIERSSRDLRAALPDLDAAVVSGTPVSKRTPAFARRLDDTLESTTALASDPGTDRALRGLTATTLTLNPQLRYLGPFITVCNFWNYFWTLVADTTSIRNAVGQSFRVISAVAAPQPNGYGSQGATRPANGGIPAGVPGAAPQFLHGQAAGAAVNADGTADCEAVQRGYPSRLASYAAPDLNVVMDAHTPGSQGPVFKSLDDLGREDRELGVRRVPEGQTFVRSPETGPKAPPQVEGGP